MSYPQWSQILCGTLSYSLMLIYHCIFIIEVWRWPYRVSLGINLQERQAWALKVMTKEGKEILGVQSTRNSLIASTLLASSSLIIAFELLKELYSLDQSGAVDSMQTGAAIVCVIFLLGSFFFFTLAIRASNHVSFLVCSHTWHECEESMWDIVNSKVREKSLEDRVIIVARTMRSLTIHFSLGLRCMYFAVPSGLWLLGPWWLLGSTIVVLGAVAALDHKIL